MLFQTILWDTKGDAIDGVAFFSRIQWAWKGSESAIKVVQTDKQKQFLICYLLKTLPWLSRIRATVTIHIQCMKKAAWTAQNISFVSRIRQNEGFKTKGEQLMREFIFGWTTLCKEK